MICVNTSTDIKLIISIRNEICSFSSYKYPIIDKTIAIINANVNKLNTSLNCTLACLLVILFKPNFAIFSYTY